MLAIWLAIAPIFGLIVLGHVLRRADVPSDAFWESVDKLVYWVMLPALLFHKMSTSKIDPTVIGSYSIVILGSFVFAVCISLLTVRLANLPGPVASSVMQGGVRHNTFIALAVSESLYGAPGLELAVLASAMLIPVTNATIVPVMISLVPSQSSRGTMSAILRDIVRNPLIVSVAIGVLVNALWGSRIPVLHDMTGLLGDAALPIVLLSIGASLKLRGLSASWMPITLALGLKLVVFPAAMILACQALGLNETQTIVALLFGAVPTATSVYAFARQLGGDAPLMAAIVTIQTALSFITIPVTVALAQRLFQ